MSESTTYLTSEEARDYLRFPTLRALYRWASARAVPKCRRGRAMLFLRRDLDEAVGNRRQQGAAGVKFGAGALRHAATLNDAASKSPLHSIEQGGDA